MSKRMARVLSMILTLVMFLSLPSPAFAWGGVDIGSGWDREIGDDEVRDFNEPVPEESSEEPTVAFQMEDEATGLKVDVEAPQGALPTLAELRVEQVLIEDVQDAVNEVVDGEPEILLALDISFWLDEHEIEPEEPVRVKISAPELEGQSNMTLVHIPDEEEPATVDLIPQEDLAFELGTDEIVFESSDFSVYAVIGGSDNAIKLTVNFYDGATLLSTQVLVKEQLSKNPLIDPGVPTLLTTQSFEGWSLVPNFDGNTQGYSVDELNTYINTTYGNMSSDQTLNVYAMKFDVIYVTYHDQAGAVLRTDSAICPVGGSVSVLVKNAYVPFKSGQNLAGWTPDILVKGDVPTYASGATVYQDGSSYSFSSDVHLYPYIKIGAWLSFDNNLDQDNDATSASYTSPVFVETGKVTQEPATPERTGYTFGGWYEDKELHTAFSFGATLAADKMVYAKWIPKQTTYMVVFWQQSANDAVGAAEADKTYDFYKSVSRTATTGQSVSINTDNTGTTADNRLGGNSTSSIGEMGYYFYYNSTKSDTAAEVVKGDGSTVLNVYYDRRKITINFYTSSSMTTKVTGTTYEPAEDGDYYYYVDPNATGYYLTGTGPYASQQPSELSTLWYGAYYTSLNGNSPTAYYSDTSNLSSQNYSSSWTYVQSTEGYWYERYYNSGYRYYPQYYYYTSQTGYYQVGTGPDTTAEGTHNLVSFNGTLTGLYDSVLTNWPDPGTGYEWKSTSGSYTSEYGMTLPAYSYKIWGTNGTTYIDTTWNIWRDTRSTDTTKTITYVGEDTNGEYTIPLFTYDLSYGHNLTIDHTLFYGYTMHEYRYGSSGSWTNLDNASNQVFSYTNTSNTFGSNSGVTIHYKRNKWDFTFESNNKDVKTESVFFQKNLSDLASYVPDNGPRGCYFDGWYADPGFDTRFNFNQEMPNHAVRIYAKWTLTRFRVVLDPTGGQQGVLASDITFVGNQATTFRLDYGDLVQGSSINNAKREGYTLLGWYLDKDYTIPFNFGQPITNEVATMGYNELPASQRQGSDPWNGGITYNDADGKHDNVRGKVVIYAKWREDPKGTIGIHVVYDAKDGTFPYDGHPTTWNDHYIYADQAEAYAQPASTPNDDSLHFLYWQVMRPTDPSDVSTLTDKDQNGNPLPRVYPGQTWKVLVDDAVYEDLSGDGTNSLTLDPANLRVIRQGKAAGTMATQTYWEPTTTIVPGDEYLIGVEVEGQIYLAVNYNVSAEGYFVQMSSGSLQNNGYYPYYYQMGYMAPAVMDGNNVTGVNGANTATDLQYCTWSFSSANGGTITSTYNSSYTLCYDYWQNSTYNYYLIRTCPFTIGTTWTWNAGNGTLRSASSQSGHTDAWYLTSYTQSGVTYLDYTTDSDDAGTIHLYHKVEVAEPDNYTVRFYGHNNELLSTQTVAAGGNATPPELPDSYVDGNDTYVAIGWDASYSNIHADTDIHAVYVLSSTQTPETSRYTVYLHAVYGRKDAGSVTHINWYSNTKDVFDNPIDQADVDAKPLATLKSELGLNTRDPETKEVAFYEGGDANKTYDPRDGYNFYYDNVQVIEDEMPIPVPYSVEGYRFLGWGRLAEGTDPDTLDADNLYLKYVDDGDGKYHFETQFTNSLSTSYSLIGTINGDDNAEIQFQSNGTCTLTTTADCNVFVKRGDGAWFMTDGLHPEKTGQYLYAAVGDLRPESDGGRGNKLFVPANTTITFTLTEKSDGTLFLRYGVGTVSESGNGWTIVDHVAANEEKPYHDFYAIWEPTGEIKWYSNVQDVALTPMELNSFTHTDISDSTENKGWYVTNSDLTLSGDGTNVPIPVSTTYTYGDGTIVYNFLGWATTPDAETPEIKWVNDHYETDTRAVATVENVNIKASDYTAELGYTKEYYAVWQTEFYVYHSGIDGTSRAASPMETVPLTRSAAGSYDLTQHVTDGTLYGGYYLTGGFTVTGGETNAWPNYDGTNWTWTTPQTAEKGMSIKPTAGQTYYIKEVPADKYLQPYFHYTYNKGTNEIASGWLISNLDDTNYTETGFAVLTANGEAQVVSSLTVVAQNSGSKVKLTSKRVFGASGLLSYWQVMDGYMFTNPDVFSPDHQIVQYWKTPDGLFVTSTNARTYNNLVDGSTMHSGDNKISANTTTVQSYVSPVIKNYNGETPSAEG